MGAVDKIAFITAGSGDNLRNSLIIGLAQAITSRDRRSLSALTVDVAHYAGSIV